MTRPPTTQVWPLLENFAIGEVARQLTWAEEPVQLFHFLRKIVRPGGLIVLDDNWARSVRTAARHYEHNLGWIAIPDAFASGTPWTIGTGFAAEAVPRCRAFRMPDPSFEPSFEEFRPF